MEKKKIQVWYPLLFSITMIAGMFIGYKLKERFPGKPFFYIEKRRTVQEVMDLIQNRYVDTVNLNSLYDTAIASILSKLDPHSIYIPAEELQAVNEEIAGNFFGIGVEFNIFNDTIHIINVINNGPSFKAGIEIGDQILQSNDAVLSGKKLPVDKIRKSLRGPLGSPVNLLILRKGNLLTIKINRDIIPVSSIDATYMINKTTGFIRINKFSKQTYREFMESLEELKKQGMQKLLLDLRGNGGGILDEAIEIADEFLEGDKLITYTQGVHSEKKEYRCRRKGQFENGELVLLVDEGSASASEILMGALQDWDRAIIIGRRSFGKGLVQEQFDLNNKAALRLTVARYYTPLGRSIQRPYKNGGKAYFQEVTDRFSNGAVISADSVKNDSSKIYITQKGKKIFGGGGITPDFFVALDTSKPGTESIKLYNTQLLNDFGYLYFVTNPGLKEQYKSPGNFNQNFAITGTEWNFFEILCKKDSINLSNISTQEKEYIIKVLKSSLARQLFRMEGYFEVMNEGDENIKKALEILNQ